MAASALFSTPAMPLFPPGTLTRTSEFPHSWRNSWSTTPPRRLFADVYSADAASALYGVAWRDGAAGCRAPLIYIATNQSDRRTTRSFLFVFT